MVRCTLLNGSAQSTERKYHEKGTKGTFDIQDEKRGDVRSNSTKRPSKDEGFQPTQQGSLTKMQAVRIASTRSGAVFVAVDRILGAVIGKEEGAVMSIPGTDGRLAQARVNVPGGMRGFVNFWHSESWTPRNEALMEAVVKQVRTTRHPWLIACDAHNICKNLCAQKTSGRVFGSKAAEVH